MFFDLFKRKKQELVEETPLTEEDEKWNKMWDLWSDGEAESPYYELMTYQSEVNNGGHDQYFLNTSDNADIKKELDSLFRILPQKSKDNLKEAYEAYLKSEENEDDEEAQAILEKCDELFWENEDEINAILKKYSESIKL